MSRRSRGRSSDEAEVDLQKQGRGRYSNHARGAWREGGGAEMLSSPSPAATRWLSPSLNVRNPPQCMRRAAADALRPASSHLPAFRTRAPLTRHHMQRAERGIARARLSRFGGAPVEPSAAWSHEDERGLRGPRVATNSCLVHARRSRLLWRTVRVRVGARKGGELAGNASRHDDSRSSCALDSCCAPHRPLSSPPLSALGVSTSDWPHRAGRPVHVRGNLTRRLGMDA